MGERGRPKKENPLSEIFGIRFTPEQKQMIEQAGTADDWRFWMLEMAQVRNGRQAQAVNNGA